jgi:hypothetical protein
MKNKGFYGINIVLLCLLFMAVAGCATSLPERTQVASQTIVNPNGDEVTFDVGEVSGGPTKQSLILGSLRLKTKEPQKAFQRSIVTKGPVATNPPVKAAPPVMPKDLKSAKLRWVPPPCAPTPPPSQTTVVILETGWYPQNILLANKGGTVQGWLVGGVEKFIGNIPFAFSGFLNPVPKINMTQNGGSMQQGQDTNNKVVGINDTKVVNPITIDNTAIGTAAAASN